MPELSVAQVQTCYPQLAEVFFGTDAYTPDGVALKPSVRRFVDVLMIAMWPSMGKAIKRERIGLGALKENVDATWEGEGPSSLVSNLSLRDITESTNWQSSTTLSKTANNQRQKMSVIGSALSKRSQRFLLAMVTRSPSRYFVNSIRTWVTC